MRLLAATKKEGSEEPSFQIRAKQSADLQTTDLCVAEREHIACGANFDEFVFVHSRCQQSLAQTV